MAHEREKRPGAIRRTAGKMWGAVRWTGRTWRNAMFGRLDEDIARHREVKDWLRDELISRRHARYSETFMESLDRQGLTLEEVDERGAQLERMFVMNAGVAVVAFVLLLCSPLSSAPILQFFSAFGMFAMTVAKAISMRFRAAQIRARMLFGFRNWFSEGMPLPDPGQTLGEQGNEHG